MVATAATATMEKPETFDARKQRILEFVQGLTVADEWYLEEIEEICFEEEEEFSEEELKLIDERMAYAIANPGTGIPLEVAIEQLKSRL